MSDAVRYDALVLAGGRGTRLGGVDKAGLVVAGRSLLTRALAAADGAEQRVVVGPGPVPDGVVQTLEQPADGGPVAGIAAGHAALERPGRPPWTLVLAVDQPAAALTVPNLLAACASVGESDPPGLVCPADADGRPQWLLALYRNDRLAARLAELDEVRDCSVRELVEPLRPCTVPVAAEHLRDVDTWQDVSHWEERLDSGPW